MPVTTSPCRSTYSSYMIARSASRIRCWITCFAVCAAMRPKLSGVTSVRAIWSGGTRDQSRARSSSATRVCWRSPVSSSMRSSSWIRVSRASSTRSVSMSVGISIPKTRNSPSTFSFTSAWRVASGVFLYAASSASSSAAIRMPSSMPFSFSMVWIPSMISWLMSLPLVDQIPAHDRVVPDVERLRSRDGQRHRVLAGGEHLAPKSLASFELPPRPDRDPAPYGRREVLPLAERPLGAGRRDLDGEVPQVPAERLGDALAECVVDAVRMVDVDAEPARREKFDREHLDSGQALFDRRSDLLLKRPLSCVDGGHTCLSKEMGAARPFRPAGEMWCREDSTGDVVGQAETPRRAWRKWASSPGCRWSS